MIKLTQWLLVINWDAGFAFWKQTWQGSLLRIYLYKSFNALYLLVRLWWNIPGFGRKSEKFSHISHPVLCWFSDTFLFPWTPGIIKAIQLDYSEAHKNLLQAIRKAPQQAAIGFKQTVSRLNQWQTIFFLFFNMVIIITIELLIETYFMVWKWRQMLYWDLQLLSDKTIETLRTAHWCLQLPSVVILYLLKSLVANFVLI